MCERAKFVLALGAAVIGGARSVAGAVLVVALSVILGTGQEIASAENSKGGFSQLEFDRPPGEGEAGGKAKDPDDNALRTILDEEPPAPKFADRVPAATPIIPLDPSKPLPGTPVAVRGEFKVLKYDWSKPLDGQGHFLTPRLRGPAVDASNERAISSEVRWEKQNGICDVSRPDLLCQKAKALKEIMYRFSGDADFHGRQCDQKCDDPSTEPVLTAFRVKDKKGQSYDIIQAGEKCRYQIVAKPGRVPWLVMEGEAGTCSCLPKGCAR